MAIFYTDSASFENITVTQNLTVLGTSSATFTENLIVDSNTIKLGNSQVLRYAGIEFVDSGSNPITSASILFDSTNNQMIYLHNGGVTSSVFLLGPETYNNQGNETYLTQNRLVKGTGIEHLADSNITDTGTLVSIVGPLSASGGITGSGFFGTASFANRSITASYASTASVAQKAVVGVVNSTGGGYLALVPIDTVDGTTQPVQYTADVNYNPDVTTLTVNGTIDTNGGNVLATNFTGTASRATSASFAVSASWAPGGQQGASFPYDGRTTPAVITGSLIVTGSTFTGAVTSTNVLDPTNPEALYVSASNINAAHIHGTLNDYIQLTVMNMSAGTNASADIVVEGDNGTEFGNFIDLGMNSSGYSAGQVGGPSDGYLYMTSSIGELHIGHAAPTSNANIRLFAGGPTSDSTTRMFISSSGQVGIGTIAPRVPLQVQGSISASSYTSSLNNAVGFFGTSSWAQTASIASTVTPGVSLTASIGSGSLFNVLEMSMAVSGTIAARAGNTVTLNLNESNYFAVSASGTGTVTWVLSNPPASGRVQSFVIEYTNGGVVTNSWFTNTRWPGGTAPTLTSGVNPDVLGFTSDDAGSNWRGVLLQRSSS